MTGQVRKRGKAHPDFSFAVRADGAAGHIAVLDARGNRPDSLDTGYKRNLLSFLSDSCAWDDCTAAGELDLVAANGQTVQCGLIPMSEWKTKLPGLLSPPVQ